MKKIKEWPWGQIIFEGICALLVIANKPEWFWYYVCASVFLHVAARHYDAMQERRLKAIREIVSEELRRDDGFNTIRGAIRTTIQEEMRRELLR